MCRWSRTEKAGLRWLTIASDNGSYEGDCRSRYGLQRRLVEARLAVASGCSARRHKREEEEEAGEKEQRKMQLRNAKVVRERSSHKVGFSFPSFPRCCLLVRQKLVSVGSPHANLKAWMRSASWVRILLSWVSFPLAACNLSVRGIAGSVLETVRI